MLWAAAEILIRGLTRFLSNYPNNERMANDQVLMSTLVQWGNLLDKNLVSFIFYTRCSNTHVGERAKLRQKTNADMAILPISIWPMTVLRLLLFLLVCGAVCTSCTIVPSRSLALGDSSAAKVPLQERQESR